MQHRDENGFLVGEIKVISSYNEDLSASMVDFEVRGGADIIFKQPEGSYFDKYVNDRNKPGTLNWTIRRDTSLVTLVDLPTIDKQESYSKALVKWLNPKQMSASPISPYVLCKNNTDKTSHLKLYCVGTDFELSSIRFLAINSSQQAGAVGFASDILCSK